MRTDHSRSPAARRHPARRRAAALLLAGALCGLPRPGAAAFQDEDLLEALGDVALFVETEVLVAGATRRVAKLSEAPGTITVVEADELRERGVLTLEEAIRYVTSLTFAPGTISLTARIRDIDQPFDNKVLLLQDGRVLNSVFRGNYFVDLSQPIDNVARIEVVRGPGSALYGANAFAGFINVITRRGDQVDGVEARLTGGNQSLGHASVVAGRARGGRNWSVDARWAAAELDDPVNPASPNAEHDDVHLALHWGRGDSKGETWFVNLDYLDVEAGVPGEFSFPSPGNDLDEKRLGLDFFRLWEPSPKTKLKLRTYYNAQDNTYRFLRAAVDLAPIGDVFINSIGGRAYDENLDPLPSTPGPGEPDSPVTCATCDHVVIGMPPGGTAMEYFDLVANGLPQVTDVQDSKEWMGFTELQADWQVTKSNYLLGGISARLDDLDNDAVGRQRFDNFALFVEDEQRFLRDELLLLGSLRLDKHSYFGLTVSPRVSLIWSPNDRLVMKTAYGKAFRSPNFVELFGRTRIGPATLYGQQRAVEEGRIPEEFVRRICLVPDCSEFRDETLRTELEQEEIQTVELWTEYTPVKRFKIILNLYQFEIANEVGVALDRNDVYFLASPVATLSIRPGSIPLPSLFRLPGLEDQPTFGVFLNAPEKTWGAGAELEIHADPWDWMSVDWNYSWRNNRQAEVGNFVELDAASADQTLVPTFSTSRFRADQSSAILTFRKKDRAWTSLRFRVLGEPDASIFDGGGSFTSDLTVGWQHQNFTVAGTVLNWNGGGTLFDPRAADFVDSDPEYRLTVGYTHAF